MADNVLINPSRAHVRLDEAVEKLQEASQLLGAYSDLDGRPEQLELLRAVVRLALERGETPDQVRRAVEAAISGKDFDWSAGIV